MARKRNEKSPSDDSPVMVPAVYAASETEAQWYVDLLNDHDISAVIGDDDDAAPAGGKGSGSRGRRLSRGMPVLVPEAVLDEASEIIAESEEMEEFNTVVDDEESEEDEEDDDLEEGFVEDGLDEDDDDDDDDEDDDDELKDGQADGEDPFEDLDEEDEEEFEG